MKGIEKEAENRRRITNEKRIHGSEGGRLGTKIKGRKARKTKWSRGRHVQGIDSTPS